MTLGSGAAGTPEVQLSDPVGASTSRLPVMAELLHAFSREHSTKMGFSRYRCTLCDMQSNTLLAQRRHHLSVHLSGVAASVRAILKSCTQRCLRVLMLRVLVLFC